MKMQRNNFFLAKSIVKYRSLRGKFVDSDLITIVFLKNKCKKRLKTIGIKFVTLVYVCARENCFSKWEIIVHENAYKLRIEFKFESIQISLATKKIQYTNEQFSHIWERGFICWTLNIASLFQMMRHWITLFYRSSVAFPHVFNSHFYDSQQWLYW